MYDRFTNKKIFLKDNNDNLIKDRLGNLIKTNYDNEVLSAIIDYKTCNINSVIRAFQNANAEVVVVSNLSDFKNMMK